jgi:hypothetical protein
VRRPADGHPGPARGVTTMGRGRRRSLWPRLSPRASLPAGPRGGPAGRKAAGLFCAALLLLAAAPAARAQPTDAGPSLPNVEAVLQGLDKVTARVSEVEAVVGAEARFGTLAITARACLESPPTEPPESAAFLEIRDVGPVGDGRTVFSGWMFASSPAVSALEHPVYDVWVVGCAEPVAVAPDGEPPASSPPPSSPGQNG